MKKNYIAFLILVFTLGLFPFDFSSAADLATRLKGRILLQVESNGEAWYVNPANSERYFLGRPADAFNLMRLLGAGISNADLEKIPASLDLLTGPDSDSDGLPDMFEDAIGTDKHKKNTDNDSFDDASEIRQGYDPRKGGGALLPLDLDFAAKQKGKIFLQVEQNGEAWYVNPADSKRYFLGRPADAFNVMRNLGLGITNNDLAKIISNGEQSSSFIQITSPNDGTIIYEEPFYIKGKTSADCGKISVTAINKEHNIDDVYTLQNYNRGDSTFQYGIKHEWDNLDVGKNEYTFRADCGNGEQVATINVFFEAGGGVEMGKPVIYLYPQEEQQIFVLPKPENGITISEPELGDGWEVTAYPDGTIVDQNGKSWPYLFWEGYSDLTTPNEGFLVHHDDLEIFFNEKLSYLGLIEKEILDFNDYWLKQLNKKDKYYFISFISQSELDEHAPIIADPMPDTAIRVFFDHKTLDTPFDFTEQTLEKGPERKGFTLIEWGGRLY